MADASLVDSPSARIRERLDHPVIDADGHFIETGPVFQQFFRDFAVQHGGGLVLVDADLAGDPADGALGAALTLHQPEHEGAGQAHHEDAGEGGRAIQRVHATDRDRHDQAREPKVGVVEGRRKGLAVRSEKDQDQILEDQQEAEGRNQT